MSGPISFVTFEILHLDLVKESNTHTNSTHKTILRTQEPCFRDMGRTVMDRSCLQQEWCPWRTVVAPMPRTQLRFTRNRDFSRFASRGQLCRPLSRSGASTRSNGTHVAPGQPKSPLDETDALTACGDRQERPSPPVLAQVEAVPPLAPACADLLRSMDCKAR